MDSLRMTWCDDKNLLPHVQWFVLHADAIRACNATDASYPASATVPTFERFAFNTICATLQHARIGMCAAPLTTAATQASSYISEPFDVRLLVRRSLAPLFHAKGVQPLTDSLLNPLYSSLPRYCRWHPANLVTNTTTLIGHSSVLALDINDYVDRIDARASTRRSAILPRHRCRRTAHAH
jgi:hypothetical protein